MRLGVNAVRLTRPFTGVGRYLECVLQAWSTMDLPFEEVTLYVPRPIAAERVVFPLDRFRVVVGGSCGPDPLWERRFLNRQAREIDVLLGPSYTLPIGYPGRCAVIYMGPAEDRFPNPNWLRSWAYDRLHRHCARRADHVFTISDTVKRQVVRDFGVPERRVTVAAAAASPLFRPQDDPSELARVRLKYGGSAAPFVLFVGKLTARHRIPELLEAFARVRAAGFPHRLVLAGPDRTRVDVPRRTRDLGLEETVRWHPFVAHRDLPALYAAAEVFVYPTTEAEGFGIPVAEAMATGVPVLSVALGSIPEVVGDAAALVPDAHAEILAPALIALLEDSQRRASLVTRGLERSREFTWARTAGHLMDRLRGIADGTARGT